MSPRKPMVFYWPEYITFVTALVFPLFIGVYFAYKKDQERTLIGYLLGNKQMNLFPVGISLISSLTNTVNMLAIPAEAYIYGTQFMATAITWIFVCLVGIYVFLPLLYSLQIINLYKYLEMRFCKIVRIVVNVLFLTKLIIFMPVIIYGTSLAINFVSGIDIFLCSSLQCIACAVYTCIGGFKAVVWTDTIQGIIMLLTVVALMILGAIQQGGLFKVFEDAVAGKRIVFFNMDPDPTIRLSFWSSTIGLFVPFIERSVISPPFVQRLISLPKEKYAKWSILVLGIGIITFTTINSIIGLVAYSAYKDCDPYSSQDILAIDQIVPFFLLDVASDIEGFSGLYLAGIICASLSTISTTLNTAAAIIFQDLATLVSPTISEEKSKFCIKCLVVILGLICLTLAYAIQGNGTIMELTITFNGLTSGTILGLFILGGFLPMVTSRGAVCGGLSGILMSVWLMIGNRLILSKSLPKVLSLSTDSCAVNVTSGQQQNGFGWGQLKAYVTLFATSVMQNAMLYILLNTRNTDSLKADTP